MSESDKCNEAFKELEKAIDEWKEPKTALIFGVTGQDGSYLSELLLSKNYKVVGVTRRHATDNTQNVSFLLANPNFKLIEGDITDSFCVSMLIEKYKPTEVYNLAAQSHVGTSFKQPGLTWDINAKGVLNILEAIRYSERKDQIKFYQASTSEMFGKNFVAKYRDDETGTLTFTPKGLASLADSELEKIKRYQDENTPFLPQSPYAIAKLSAHHLCRNYRDGYGVFASCGILFNHESPRRGESFVTRKITKWIGEFKRWSIENRANRYDVESDENNIVGYHHTIIDSKKVDVLFPKLRLGNLDAKRDWGYAGDYVEAMWLMLQEQEADDYVIATGETYSVREFLDVAFAEIGIDDWDNYVVVDPEFYRPAEVDYLLGDPTKAKDKLQWEPRVSFKELVKLMVKEDCDVS